eukprot:g6755.t1
MGQGYAPLQRTDMEPPEATAWVVGWKIETKPRGPSPEPTAAKVPSFAHEAAIVSLTESGLGSYCMGGGLEDVVVKFRPAAPVSVAGQVPQELIPEGYESCFKNLTYFVEVDGMFSLPHAREARYSSALECQQACAQTYRCEHFSFWSSGGCLLTSYSSYSRTERSTPLGRREAAVSSSRSPSDAVIDRPRPRSEGANVPPFVAKEAPGCGSLHDEYETWLKPEPAKTGARSLGIVRFVWCL